MSMSVDYLRDTFNYAAKRARRISEGPSTQTYPISAGATNVIQRAVVKQRSGKRIKRKTVEYLYRLQKACTTVAICRFQAMSEYDKNGFSKIGYRKTSETTHLYPVFIFDLTSTRSRIGNVDVTAQPLYRLTDVNGDFNWSVGDGVEPDGTVTADSRGWFVEMNRGPSDGDQSLAQGRNSMLAWSDIRLALYGATSQSTRFNVLFIQFTDECYHPRATRTNPAVPATSTAAVDDQQGRFNAAMEELVKPLVFHPLHSAGNATNVYRVLESKSYLIQPDININEAVASPNVCVKNFKQMNRICKWAWQTSDKKVTTTSTENKIDPVAGLDLNASYNQFLGGDRKPYVHPNARVYMMITAQAYTKTSSVAPVVTEQDSNTPSFDLLVRNKWLFDSTV